MLVTVFKICCLSAILARTQCQTTNPSSSNPVTNGSVVSTAYPTTNPVVVSTAYPTTNPVVVTTAYPVTNPPSVNPVTNGSVVTTANPVTNPPSTNPVTSGPIVTTANPVTTMPTVPQLYSGVPVQLMFTILGQPFTTDLLDKRSSAFILLEKNVSDALNIVLGGDIKNATVLKFSPGSVRVTSLFTVIVKEVDSVLKVNQTIQDRIGKAGYLGHLRVDKDDYTFLAEDSVCQRPVVKITNLGHSLKFSTEVKRSDSYIVQTSINLHCTNVTTAATFEWYVWRASGIASFPLKLVANGTTEWTMTKQALDYGLYMVEFRVTMVPSNLSNSDVKYLSIVQSPLHAEILGGSYVKRGLNQNIELDASPSRDPDVNPGNYSGMEYTWLCKKKDETFPKVPLASIPVVNSNGVKGKGGCFDTGIGKLSSTARQATINAGYLKVNNAYTIRLVVRKTGRTSFYEQLLEVVLGEPPQMTISCLINCGVKASPTSRLKLTSKCLSPLQTCARPLQYQWSMENWDPSTNSWRPVSGLKEKFSTALDSPDAVIKADSFSSVSPKKYRLSIVASSPGITPGRSSYDFQFNSPPDSGTCSVTPTTGYGLKTDFTFKCKDWQDSDLPLKYQIYYVPEPGLTSVILYGSTPMGTSKLPTGKAENNYAVKIYFRIIDGLSTFAEVTNTVTVSVDTSMSEDETEKVVQDSTEQVGNLFKVGDVKQATQLANAVLDTISSSSSSILNSTKKTQIVDNILEETTNVQPSNLETLAQVTSVIGRATKNPEEVSQTAENKTLKALDQMTMLLAEKSEDSNAAEDSLVEAGGENLALCLGNMMRSSSSKAKVTHGQPAQEKSKESIKVAETSVKLVNNVGVSLLKRKVVGEKPSTIETTSLSMVLNRQRPRDLGGTKLAQGGNSFVLPSKGVLGGGLRQRLKFVDSQVTITKFNPFTWDATANSIESDVVSMVLRNDQSQDITVKDLTEDIKITISNSGPLPNRTSTEMSFIKPGTIRSYKYYISHPGTGLELNITVEDLSSLSILVRRGQKPTTSSNDFSSRIITLPSCGTSRVLLKVCRRNSNQLFLSAKLLSQKDTYYVGLYMETSKSHSRRKRSCFGHGRQKRSCVEPKDPPKPENTTIIPVYNPKTDLNYSISSQKYDCRYWSGAQWTSTGCKAGSNSTSVALECLCNHLTSFGGSLLIEPNPIDFDHVLLELSRLDETGNIAVLTTLIVFLFVYLLVAIVARRADRRDEQKSGPPIQVSSTDDGFRYEMIIRTGVWRKSGTTSNVAIVIHGTDSTSGQIILSPTMVPSRLIFATGNADKFIVCLPVPLGSIEYLNVRHDNSGDSPTWYLEQINIKDLQSGSCWFFLHQDWLSLEKGNEYINKVLTPTSPLEMRSFAYSFNYRTTKKFTEDHIWLSVVTKPPYSNFTRVQRATCCLVLLFSVMVVNAMFYKTTKTPDPRIQVGPLKFSWRQIVVGIYSSLIIVPIGMAIIVLFRNSRGKNSQQRKGRQKKLSNCFCCCCNRSKKNQISDSSEVLTLHEVNPDGDHCGSISKTNGRCISSHSINMAVCYEVRNAEHDEMDPRAKKSKRSISDLSRDTNETILSEMDGTKSSEKVPLSITTQTITSSNQQVAQSNRASNEQDSCHETKSTENFSCIESIRNILTESISSSKDEDGGFSLPHGCIYIAWIICIITVFVSASFTFIYSLQWGKEIANQWLSSILISFSQDLFVIQPLKIVIVAIFLSCLIRKRETIQEQVTESSKVAVDATNSPTNNTKATFSEMEMKIIEEKALEEAREYQLKEHEMFSFFRESLMYGVFLILLTIVCYGNRSYLGYAQTTTIMNDFNNFTKIRTGQAYWKWIASQFASSAYAGKWYNGEKESNEVYIGNKRSILLGMPRIRQLRIKPDTCIVPKDMKFMISKCYDEYSSDEEDTTPYYVPGWKTLPSGDLKWWANITQLCPKPWRYASAKELSLLPLWGYHYLYSGGGYVVDLGYRNSTSSFATLPLSKNQWIDPRTRALLLEFSTFNPSSNILSTVTFFYEVLPFMLGHPFRRVETIALYGTESASYSFFLVCKLLFIFMVFFMFAREARRAYKMRSIYFKMFWNLFEVLQTIMASLVVVCYVVKEKMILDAVQQIQENPYITVNFHSAVAWKYAEDVVLSIAVFVATVKILRLLRFNSHIIMFNSSLKNSRSTLFSYSIILLVAIMSFAAVCKLSLGTSMEEYRTFRQSIYTQILLALGSKIDMQTLKDGSLVLGPLTNFAYKLLMAFFFVNFYVAVINDTYGDVKSKTDRNAKEFEMSDFIIDRFKVMILGKKVKIPGRKKSSKALDRDEKISNGNLKDDEAGLVANDSEQVRSDVTDDLDDDIEKGLRFHDQVEHLNSRKASTEHETSEIEEPNQQGFHCKEEERYPSRIGCANDCKTSQENEERNEESASNLPQNFHHYPKIEILKSSVCKIATVKTSKEGIKEEFLDPEAAERNWDIEEKGSIIYEQTMALTEDDNKEDIEYLKNICLVWTNLMLNKYRTLQHQSTPEPEIGEENEGYERRDSDSIETYDDEDVDYDELWGEIETILKDAISSLQPRIPSHLRMKHFFAPLLKK